MEHRRKEKRYRRHSSSLTIATKPDQKHKKKYIKIIILTRRTNFLHNVIRKTILGWVWQTTTRFHLAKWSLVIDNATWHSELTENSKPFRRMMRKDRRIDWLENDELQFDSTLKKSELLEIAFNNKTRKEYKV
jgi:hypothetical protein